MFNPSNLTDAEYDIFCSFVPNSERRLSPDVEISDGEDGTYLFRWHLIPRNPLANSYLHIQVASDPARPLHDHPWWNQSVILSGGYDELWSPYGKIAPKVRAVRAGDVVQRNATEAHRLILPQGINRTITCFTTGPVIREWGFYCKDGWRPYHECTVLKDGKTWWKEGVE